jgi:tRNA pseudouridine55 synthase
MIDGILIVDKQVGITSYDVIRKLKKILGKSTKIGHAGTLDPFASGVLIILLGSCTKLMNDISALKKEYIVTATLGIATDTQDITGEVIKESEKIVEIEDIELTIENNLVGEIKQIPPKYSAKKVEGKRAYDLAREGEEFELKPSIVNIYKFEVLDYIYPTLICKILCGSGTYVRTLINDLGNILRCFGTASELKRTSIGDFNLSQSISSKDLIGLELEELQSYVISVDKVKEILGNE